MGENLFLDTNALIQLQKEAFKEDKFYISSITLNELENIKTSFNKDEEVKYAARHALHLLQENQDKYEVISYTTKLDKVIKKYNLPDTPDSKIIVSALSVDDVTFVSNDLACYMLAKSVGLKTEFVKQESIEYSGYEERIFSEEELNNFYSSYIQSGYNPYNLLNNEYLLIRDNNNKVIDKYKWTTDKGYIKIPFIKIESKLFGKVAPYEGDPYQQLALDSLENDQVTLLAGPPGSGKTFLSLGYLFNQLEKGFIDRIIIFCNPVVAKGAARLGFMPGTKDEKLLASQVGNVLTSKLGGEDIVEDMINKGKIVLLPVGDARGYQVPPYSGVYILESQNLSVELLKLILQRVSENTKVIVDGDFQNQVDQSIYAGSENGMRRMIQIFKGSELYSQVVLKNIYRSKLAEIAERMN